MSNLEDQPSATNSHHQFNSQNKARNNRNVVYQQNENKNTFNTLIPHGSDGHFRQAIKPGVLSSKSKGKQNRS